VDSKNEFFRFFENSLESYDTTSWPRWVGNNVSKMVSVELACVSSIIYQHKLITNK